jgi:hypothetical protein
MIWWSCTGYRRYNSTMERSSEATVAAFLALPILKRRPRDQFQDREGWVVVRVASGRLVMILGGCYRNPMGYRPRSRKSQGVGHRDRVVPATWTTIPLVVIGIREPRAANVDLTGK